MANLQRQVVHCADEGSDQQTFDQVTLMIASCKRDIKRVAIQTGSVVFLADRHTAVMRQAL